jgi:signal transduction histidine kinase
VNVEQTFAEAISALTDLRDIKVMNQCQGLTVLADSLLRQLLYNLIHNSLTHGKKVSQIKAYYKESEENQLKLVYEDDGVGIPKAEKEKIFQEGYGKGTGYGLYLIRKICEVYDWTIRETGKHGEGAQFTITLPRADDKGKKLYKIGQNR